MSQDQVRERCHSFPVGYLRAVSLIEVIKNRRGGSFGAVQIAYQTLQVLRGRGEDMPGDHLHGSQFGPLASRLRLHSDR